MYVTMYSCIHNSVLLMFLTYCKSFKKGSYTEEIP